MNALLQVGWTWYPSVIIGFSIWTALYMFAIRKGNSTPWTQQFAFHLGTLFGLIALISPLDELGDEYLFSAHMLQHLLLMFVTPPLWLLGTPGWLADKIIPKGLTRLVEWLTSPTVAFAAFASIMCIWHIPSLYQLAQEYEGVHIFDHLTYIGAALIGWWPVMGAETSRIPKPEPPTRMLYLFLLSIPCTALGALLTLAHAPFYSFYVTAPHPFGLNALQDQHLGGLLMWMPTHMFLLLALGITFLKWFVNSDRQTEHDFTKSLL
ncbi:MAG: cytochrome c oxidase assembly protein [Anaerolineales bacterium]|nr:cytochrome c oxidase assembly protein [Anaerolineales bacterium]